MRETELTLFGWPVKVDARLPGDSFIFVEVDEHGRPVEAAGYVNGEHVRVRRDEVFGPTPTGGEADDV